MKKLILSSLLMSISCMPALAYQETTIAKLLRMDDTAGLLNGGVEIGGKRISGFDFDFCVHENTRIDYCSATNSKKIINAASKPTGKKFASEYDVVVLESPDKLTKSFALVDAKKKKVFTSGLEYDYRGKLTYDTKKGGYKLYVDTEITNGFNYHGGSRSYGGPGDPTNIHFHPNSRGGVVDPRFKLRIPGFD